MLLSYDDPAGLKTFNDNLQLVCLSMMNAIHSTIKIAACVWPNSSKIANDDGFDKYIEVEVRVTHPESLLHSNAERVIRGNIKADSLLHIVLGLITSCMDNVKKAVEELSINRC